MSSEAFFKPIDPNNPVNTIPSMCELCGGNGSTNLMLTSVPFFKELIIGTFTCDSCGYKNTEVTFGGKLADFGVRMTCKVVSPAHLNRLVVKSEYASIKIPELNLDIPPRTQKGSMNSVEGILNKMIEGLQEGQEDRRENDPESYSKIAEFIELAKQYASGAKLPFTILLDDPSGNSYIQNPYAPNTDPYNTVEYYIRTKEQLIEMGYLAEGVETEAKKEAIDNTRVELEKAMLNLGTAKKEESDKMKAEVCKEESKVTKKKEIKKHVYTEEEIKALTDKLQEIKLKQQGTTVYQNKITAQGVDFSKPLSEVNSAEEAMVFDTPCYACGQMGKNRMCVCSIPHFKEIIVMCFECEHCGYKSAEVKGGGGISEKAKRLTLSVKSPKDLSRDLYKADSCAVYIPEIGVEVESGTMGSVYTTVEGLIEQIHNNLKAANPFGVGDSAESEKFKNFLNKLKALNAELNFTLVLDDPLSNSFIYSSLYPNPDPQISEYEYERTKEQNDELGISDMKVD